MSHMSGWVGCCLVVVCLGYSGLAAAQTPGTAGEQAPQSTAAASEVATGSRELARLFADYHEQYLILFPLEATAIGDNRYNALLRVDIAPEEIARTRAFYETTLDRLQNADRAQADATQLLAADILAYELNIRLAGLQFDSQRMAWNQFDGLPLSFGQLGSGAGNQPFKSVQDYENWLQRVAAFQAWMTEAIQQFRAGMASGYVLPEVLVKRMITQCEAPSIQAEDVHQSLFFGPIEKLPAEFSEADKQRLSADYTRAIRQRIQPAYRQMAEFLKHEYLPQARSTSGIGAVPMGREQYAYLVRYWTTTDLTPEEIFAIGEREVARIRGEMESVQRDLNFQGTLQEFFEHVRTDPAFMPFETPEQVLAAFHEIHRRLEPNVDRMFLRRPQADFEIRRTEAFREKTASAEYNPGSADGSRPGIFYLPIPDAKSFNVTSGMESLFLHEAIPGHHFQISLQQENQQLPKFARFLWYGAYGEGWALYCESLGKELGLYTDPKQYMGALGDEMHRAIRLVVDVGMHWKGWTREEALAYMLANEPISEEGAIAEIERYMAIPAQALSYKIGALKIRQLREKYTASLGERFHIAEFHEQVLKDGSMPLSILEQRLDRWAAERAQGDISNNGKVP
jgi:uncharacterized protein (DUF885 family)